MGDYRTTLGVAIDDSGVDSGLKEISSNLMSLAKQAEKASGVASGGITNVKKGMRQMVGETKNLTVQYQRLTDAEKNSDMGRRIAEQIDIVKTKAGELKDLSLDIDREITNIASDTRTWDSVKEGISVVQGFGQTAVSVYGALGGSIEETTRAMNAFNSIGAASSTVIATINALQKESATLDLVRRIQSWAAAQAAVTTGIRSTTVAQTAFNAVAKANPYVLLATALITVGGAVAAYIGLTNDSTEAQKKNAETTRQLAELYANTYGRTVADLHTKYDTLKESYARLKSEHDKNKWIKDNQKSFEDLGLSVYGVSDAEEAFMNNTPQVIQALSDRAKAIAELTVLQKEYEEALTKPKKQKGEHVTFNSREQAQLYERKGWTIQGSPTALSQAGADHINRIEEKMAQNKFDEGFKKISKKRQNAEKRLKDATESGRKDKENPFEKKTKAKTKKKKADGKKGKLTFSGLTDKDLSALKRNAERDSREKDDRLKAAQDQTKDYWRKKKESRDTASRNESQDKARNDKTAWYENSRKQIEGTSEMMKDGLIPKDVGKAVIDQINAEIQSNGLQPIKVDLDTDGASKGLSDIMGLMQDFGALAGEMGNVFEDSTLNAASILAVGIAQMVVSFAAALKSCKTWYEWLAFSVTGTAALVSMIGQVKSAGAFAQGGIVGGSSYTGDKLVASVNSGEMILNGKQQSHLFDMIDNGTANQTATVSSVRIKGSDLYVALKNYSTVKGKSGKITGIK